VQGVASEPAVPPDRGRITVFQGSTSHQRPRQVNGVVRRLGEAMVTGVMAKSLLALHGDVRPQPPSDWTGAFPIPPAVERFYREVGPANITIRAHGNPYFLPCLADLWQFQAGYRWNGLSSEPIEDWDDDWLVVADEAGDPFIITRPSGAVLHAYHGEGVEKKRGRESLYSYLVHLV
jgi:hypothetical protein